MNYNTFAFQKVLTFLLSLSILANSPQHAMSLSCIRPRSASGIKAWNGDNEIEISHSGTFVDVDS